MTDAIYHLTIIVLAALGAVRGYHSGLHGQAASFLGLCFGIISAHLFFEPVYCWLSGILPEWRLRLGGDCLLQMLSASSVFCAVYLLLAALTFILRNIMSVFSMGIISSIFGAFLCMLKYLFFVSICFNLIVDYNPYSSLLKFATDGDGNVVAGVMSIAPVAFGVPDCDDLYHLRRLEEARKISRLKTENGNWSNQLFYTLGRYNNRIYYKTPYLNSYRIVFYSRYA